MSKRLRWRRLNRLRAQLGGYFWLPCPLCGQMFGGHEYGDRVVDDDGNDSLRGRVCCRGCNDPSGMYVIGIADIGQLKMGGQ